jgi:lycopene beta-cyclase
MRKDLTASFDFLFIGMGAANCLLLLKMHENGLLWHKKIAIIEPSDKVVNDRNFCFWSDEEEVSKLSLQDLVSSKWSQIKVADREYQSISPNYYYHIRGIHLYDKVKEILKSLAVQHYKEAFNTAPILQNESYIIHLADIKIEAKQVFDSRPPSYHLAKKNESHLLQSFYGWEVVTQDYTFDTSTMVMMDFNIPQQDYCQFMYLLPFTENTALFEVTRFGKEKITKEEAEQLLTKYLSSLGFSYEIMDEEKGVIPMSSVQIAAVNYGKNWVLTGANANMVKPTTGYAFHNMAVDAHKQVEAMVEKRPFVRAERQIRFKFYDNLLLKILAETPQYGKQIFQDLFNHISLHNVLAFLGEKSSLSKEITIFAKLPILTFLKVAFKDILYRLSRLQPTYLALISTVFFVLLYALHLAAVPWIFLGTGFLTIGLSHGAVDHLTDTTIQGRRQYIQFIVSYLLKGSLLGLLWLVLPDVALFAFIAFSAWHFGQADFRQWNIKQGFNTFIWGFFVLSTILFYHQAETIAVLQQIKGLQIHHLLANLSANQRLIGKLGISVFSILFALYHKNKLMYITLCYLLLSSILPLFFSFGIYFVMQHSMHGWKHLKADLNISSYNLWLKSLPFSTGGALIFLVFMLADSAAYLGIFFIVLSSISMPHVFSMHYFYERLNGK